MGWEEEGVLFGVGAFFWGVGGVGRSIVESLQIRFEERENQESNGTFVHSQASAEIATAMFTERRNRGSVIPRTLSSISWRIPVLFFPWLVPVEQRSEEEHSRTMWTL